MYVYFLAFRYLISRPVRYLGMVSIGIGVTALIVVVSVMNGFLAETRSIVRGTTADLIVFPLQIEGSEPVKAGVIESMAEAQEGVSGAVSRLVRPGIYKTHTEGNDTTGAQTSVFTVMNSRDASLNQIFVLGINPDEEGRVSRLTEFLRVREPGTRRITGRLISGVEDPTLAVDDTRRPFRVHPGLIAGSLRNADLPRAIVGEELLRVVGLRKGDAIDIVTLPDKIDLSGGDTVRPTMATFIISGAFHTGHYDFDMNHVFIENADFRVWSGTKYEVSEVYVRVEEGVDLDRVKAALNIELERAGLFAEVQTWRDRHAIMLGAVENERNILGIVLFLFVLLTCTVTFSMLAMMVQEKIRDIGILSAMGASAPGIGAIFALCGGLIATVGGVLGLVAGTYASLHVNELKDWIEVTFDIEIFQKNVYAFTDIPASIHHGLDGAITLVTILFAVLICLIPAWKAANMDPVQALRHE